MHQGSEYVADQVIKLMTARKVQVVDSNVLVMGLAFKENCPDIRNTRVVDLVEEFRRYHAVVDVYDPWVDAKDADTEHGITLLTELGSRKYDAIVVAVAHDVFREIGLDGIRDLGRPGCVIFDVKNVVPNGAQVSRL